MHAQGLLALCIDENASRVSRIRMHRAHDPARVISADGDEAEIKGATGLADGLEGGADGEVGVFGMSVVVVHFLVIWGGGDCAVSGVAGKVDGFGGGRDRPGAPEGFGTVKEAAVGSVLAGEEFDCCGDGGGGRRAGDGFGVGVGRGGGKGNGTGFEPVEFDAVGDVDAVEPGFVAEGDEKVDGGMERVDFLDGGEVEMVVVVVAYYDGIDDWEVGDLAGSFGVAFRTHELNGGASLSEDGVKENSQSFGEFNIVTGVSQPSCSEICGIGMTGFKIGGFPDGEFTVFGGWSGSVSIVPATPVGPRQYHHPRESLCRGVTYNAIPERTFQIDGACQLGHGLSNPFPFGK